MKFTARLFSLILALIIAAGAIPSGHALAASESAIDRMGGNDRYHTASIIAGRSYNRASMAIIAGGEGYADALAAAPLAYSLDAPILLTAKNHISADVLARLQALECEQVLVLGGTAAVSDGVIRTLEAEGYSTTRLGGATRYETAVMIAIAMELYAGIIPDTAFIACGTNYPDALSASPAAALMGAPILYSPPSGQLDPLTGSYLIDSMIDSAYILGGKNAVDEYARELMDAIGIDSITRLGGTNRYDTSAVISRHFDYLYGGSGVSFATGLNYPDALAGSIFAAVNRIPVLLTDNRSIDSGIRSYIDSRDHSTAYVFGGNNVVSDDIVSRYLSITPIAPPTTAITTTTTTTTEPTEATSTTTTTTTVATASSTEAAPTTSATESTTTSTTVIVPTTNTTTTTPTAATTTTTTTTAKPTTTTTTTTTATTTTTTTTTATTTTTTTTTKPTTTGTTVPAKSYEEQVLELVNQERSKAGLPPLSGSNSKLNAAAAKRAQELVKSYSHNRPDGTVCFTALDEFGISYWSAGENIAYGQTTPSWVMNSWMNSTGHRENILNSNFTQIGIGHVYHNGTHYWVQMFIG